MKTILLLLLFLLTSGISIAQKLEGAFVLTGGQHGDKLLSKADIHKERIIKIFKSGYWIGAYFGNPEQPFNGTCGGTYKTEKGKYIESVDFYSWDNSAVGKTYTFNYTLSNHRYIQDGKMDSEKYPNHIIKEEFSKLTSNIPLKDTSMEGAWHLQDATRKEESGKETQVKQYEEIKIYAYPRFAYAQYNPATKEFVGAGGGTYEYDGKKLIEHVEYTTYGNLLGSNYEIQTATLTNGVIQQLSQKGTYKEIWKKAKE